MNTEILTYLQKITDEEQAILDGRTTIDRDIYMQGDENTINSRKLLAAGKLITLRPCTRFIHFPAHSHDYVEVVYVCAGKSIHIVNGKEIRLQQGDLLFLSQSAVHEVLRAELEDIAVNFIVLPEFFVSSLTAVGEEETPLRRFLVDCLCGQKNGPGYLQFRVSHLIPVQNLMENLLWTLIRETPSKRNVCQMTMALLFMQLLNDTDALVTENREEEAVIKALRYLETNYVDGKLTEVAELLHYDVSSLSRQIKQKTGKNYIQLVQEKRLAQAVFLLKNTNQNVADISVAVGYENISYFHRIFTAAFGMSPKHFRDQDKVAK